MWMSLINSDSLFRSNPTVSQLLHFSLKRSVLCSWQRLKSFVVFVTGFVAFILWKKGKLGQFGGWGISWITQKIQICIRELRIQGRFHLGLQGMLWGNWDEFVTFLKLNQQCPRSGFVGKDHKHKSKTAQVTPEFGLFCAVDVLNLDREQFFALEMKI